METNRCCIRDNDSSWKLETLPSTISKKEQLVVEQIIGVRLVIKCPQVTELIDSAVDIFETQS